MTRLRRNGIWLRVAAIIAIAAAMFLVRVMDPALLARFGFRTSCGAISGLPCIFCGTTRALHHLLNGDFARALYFNWLAFPTTALFVALCAKLAAEIMMRRRICITVPKFNFTPRLLAAGLASVFALWVLQVSLAIGLHKQELLNSRGILYALLVK